MFKPQSGVNPPTSSKPWGFLFNKSAFCFSLKTTEALSKTQCFKLQTLRGHSQPRNAWKPGADTEDSLLEGQLLYMTIYIYIDMENVEGAVQRLKYT